MTINLFSDFAKRKNSTKRPETDGMPFEGELKKDFALTGLVVKFSFTDAEEIPPYNYAYIPSFSRYYFITEWFFEMGLWQAVLAEDVLASFKEQIGNSNQFINRSGSKRTFSGNTLIDVNAKTCGPIIRKSSYISPENFWGAGITSDSGLIVVGCVGNSPGSIGVVTYYAMSMYIFRNFLYSMLSSPDWMGINTSEISTQLQKALINPTQYIVYCRWFPINATLFLQGLIPQSFSAGTSVDRLALGWWTFPLIENAIRLDTVGSGWIYRNASFDIPKHPYQGDDKAFYNFSPYSTYTLAMPPFGVFEIDSTELFGKDKLGIEVNFSLLTGDATFKACAVNSGEPLDFYNSFLIYEGQVGVQLPVAQVAGNIGNYKSAIGVGAISGLDAILTGG